MNRIILLISLLFLGLAPISRAQGEGTPPPTPPSGPTSLDTVWDDRKVPESAAEVAAQLKLVMAALAATTAEEEAALAKELTVQKEALDALAVSFAKAPIEERKADYEARKAALEAKKAQLQAELARKLPIADGPVEDAVFAEVEKVKIAAESASNQAAATASSIAQESASTAEKASKLESRLQTVRAESADAESDRIAKSDAAVSELERRVAIEKAWAYRLRAAAREAELSRIRARQAAELPSLESTVAALEKEVADLERRIAERDYDLVVQQRRRHTEKQAREARANRDEIAKRLEGEASRHERPFLELRLRQLNALAEAKELKSKVDKLKETGPVRKSLPAANEIKRDIQREKAGEQILPRDADSLRMLVERVDRHIEIARQTRNRMRDERARIRGIMAEIPTKSSALEIVAAAKSAWEAAGGRQAPFPITDEEWKELGAAFVESSADKQKYAEDVLAEENRLDKQSVELWELAETNRVFLRDRLIWTRDPSDVSLASIEQAIEDGGRAVDRVGELPQRLWATVKAFVNAERTNAIIGGVLIVFMLVFLLFAHRKLPDSYSYFDERTGVAHALGTVLRRTDFTFTVAIVFVGIPWAIGLARGAVVFLAALFAAPFFYRFGRVVVDVLFAPESDEDRVVRIDGKLARLFHFTGRTLLNVAIVFVPAGMLMRAAGYQVKNPGFVELWWLIFSVLMLVILLFTIFRPAVVGRLIRGDGVVAVSVKTWILILYPVLVGAVIFLFVLHTLRYVEASQFFRGLFLRSAGLLLGGFILYRVALRRYMDGRKVETVQSADDYDSEDEYLTAGRRNFADTSMRWVLRLVFLLPAVFLLVRTWQGVKFGSVDEAAPGDGVTIQSAFWAIIAVSVTAVVARIVKKGLTFVVLARSDLDRGMRYTVVTVATYVIWAVGLIIALNLLRVKGEQIAMVVSALMFGLGFGLQSIVKNFVSGLILLAERPVKVGDRVNVPGGSGVVEKITLRATTVMTWEGVGIVIPNEEMIGGTLTNQSLGQPRLRTDLPFGVAYGSDIERVRDLVMEVVRNHGLVLKRPGPEVFFMGFGDSSLDFEVRYWTILTTHRLRVVSDLRFAIEAAFSREDIEIPFPQRDLHVRTVDPAIGGGLFGEPKFEEEKDVGSEDGEENAEESR